jgi:hypothetical protein
VAIGPAQALEQVALVARALELAADVDVAMTISMETGIAA